MSKQEFFEQLASNMASDIMVYKMRSEIDSTYKVLPKGQVTAWEQVLADIRSHYEGLSQDQVDKNKRNFFI